MASLQVRDFPEELYDELKMRAKRENRSISQQTIIAVREHVTEDWNRRPINAFRKEGEPSRGGAFQYLERRLKVFEEIDTLPRVVIPPGSPSIVEIIHEGRDER